MLKRVALVTGASSGFGMLTSLELARAGFQVVATIRNPEKQIRLREAAAQAGIEANLSVVSLDVNDPERIQEVISQVIERYGRIDVLVNNAGFALAGLAETIPMAEWKSQFETNVFGVIGMTQAVLPFMRHQRSGTIINLSSISGRIGFPLMAPYVASKHAVEGFSEALRLELAPFGIRVVLIEPGAYQTDIWEKGIASACLASDSDYAQLKEYVMAQVGQSANTGGDPKEVARLIVKVANHADPKLRYPIGRGVKQAIRLKQILPWAWLEKLFIRQVYKRKQGRHDS